jgi:uncharacterized protein YndB with AHSA1/START domain
MIAAAMRPVTVSCVVDAPRERVFDYLADIAHHGEFTDHFVDEFRLDRLESRGVGAAARLRLGAAPRLPFISPFARLWAGIEIKALEPPHRVLIEGRTGRVGRVPIRSEYLLAPHGHGMTKVTHTFASEPTARIDRMWEGLGGRGWVKRKLARGLRRLRTTVEQGESLPRPARVAAG